jgi:hypothetical protein
VRVCPEGLPVADLPAKRILGLMSWRLTDPANDRGPHHRPVKAASLSLMISSPIG